MTDETNVIERKFWAACDELDTSDVIKGHLKSFLSPLRNKSSDTHLHYLHSLRVGLLARQIGAFTHHEEKPLLLAGALHDLGKCQTALEVLGKTRSFTRADQKEIRRHVMDGYRMLRGHFDLTAEIMLWHHKFQEDGYPKKLPPLLHDYKEQTMLLIVEYGRIVALADVYDALHRINDKFGETKKLSGEEITKKMLEFNPDRTKLVLTLYEAGIFTA